MKDFLHIHDYRPINVLYFPDRTERVFECQCGDRRKMTYKYTEEEMKRGLSDDNSR